MSLVRAFTTRRTKQSDATAQMHIGRAASQRGARPVLRNQISLPVELISTTNNLVNYAPDIVGTTPIPRNVSAGSSASSASSVTGEDSDGSTAAASIHDTITDASSFDEASPIEPAPNHLSCYFKPNVETTSPVPSRSPSISQRNSMDAPDLPQRAPSHSKKAHERINRKRSIQRMMSPPPRSSKEFRSSSEIFNSQSAATQVEAPRESPFGKELAQLDEVAEEFGQVVRDVESDADRVYMETRGLAHFGASDYMNEIQDLLTSLYEESTPELGGWI